MGALELAKAHEEELSGYAKEAADASHLASELLKKNRLYFTRELAQSADTVLTAVYIAASSYELPQIRAQALEIWGGGKRKSLH